VAEHGTGIQFPKDGKEISLYNGFRTILKIWGILSGCNLSQLASRFHLHICLLNEESLDEKTTSGRSIGKIFSIKTLLEG